MKTKLILDLTKFKGFERQLFSTITQAGLQGIGFSWEDGSQTLRNPDADAIMVNHPRAESPLHMFTYGNGRFDQNARANVLKGADCQIFDASDTHQLESFLQGVEFL